MKNDNEKYCKDCGELINVNAEICPKCGCRQLAAPMPPISNVLGVSNNGRSRTVAGIVALLLGGLGIHKFYLGKTAQGILYLVFCWTWIPALFGLIDGITLLSMKDDAFNSKYPA